MINLQDTSIIKNETGNMVISPAIHKGTNGYVMWYVNSIEKPREICRSFFYRWEKVEQKRNMSST